MRSFVRAFERLEEVFSWLGGGIALIIMLAMTADVIMRYALNKPIIGVKEITAESMPFIIFTAWAYGERMGRHIKVSFLTQSLPSSITKGITTFSMSLLVIFMMIIVWQSGVAAIDLWQIGETNAGLYPIPKYPARTIVPLGAAMFTVRLVIGLVERIRPSVKTKSQALSGEREGAV